MLTPSAFRPSALAVKFKFAEWALAVGLLFLTLACQSELRRPPAAPAGNIVHPIVYLPSDLDLVLRLNVGKYRETMGPDPELSIERLWESFGPQNAPFAETREPFVSLLKGCDSLWLGCRLDEKGCRDFVFVLRGSWPRTYNEYGFGPAHNKRDLGGGWLSFDFNSPERSAIARLYWRAPELAVLVSSAELDSVERSLEQSSGATGLEPSEDGILSLVARSAGLARLLRARTQKGAEWLAQSEQIEMRFEPSAAETVATFTIAFADEDRAQRSAEAFRILVSALTGVDARFDAKHVILERLGSHVVLRVAITNPEHQPQNP
jgi:hypothetical protein